MKPVSPPLSHGVTLTAPMRACNPPACSSTAKVVSYSPSDRRSCRRTYAASFSQLPMITCGVASRSWPFTGEF